MNQEENQASSLVWSVLENFDDQFLGKHGVEKIVLPGKILNYIHDCIFECDIVELIGHDIEIIETVQVWLGMTSRDLLPVNPVHVKIEGSGTIIGKVHNSIVGLSKAAHEGSFGEFQNNALHCQIKFRSSLLDTIHCSNF